jgi:hypothetical protein
VSCFNLFLDSSGGKGAPLFIYFDFFYCGGRGEGVEVNVFFPPIHLTCGRSKGKGLVFFFFFHY